MVKLQQPATHPRSRNMSATADGEKCIWIALKPKKRWELLRFLEIWNQWNDWILWISYYTAYILAFGAIIVVVSSNLHQFWEINLFYTPTYLCFVVILIWLLSLLSGKLPPSFVSTYPPNDKWQVSISLQLNCGDDRDLFAYVHQIL